MPSTRLPLTVATCILANVFLAVSQLLPNTFPHSYPGQPEGDFSPAYQSYFQVTEPLPNVTFSIGRSFAGNIPVQRDGHPNNTLFFWAFEKQNGSLTVAANESNNEPWGIWLNGGPGSSSMYGALFENGPIRINSDYSATPNNYSWDRLADYIWIDQPVGTGYSTADSEGYIADEDQMGRDFFGFLGNLVKVFPSLATRPLHITGESYCGVYIPYILKTYFGLQHPPVNIVKVAIGDGSIASGQVTEFLPALSIIETYPQLIGYDPDVYKYFEEQDHLCGYDINLTYPQNGIIPAPELIFPEAPNISLLQNQLTHYNFMSKLTRRYLDLDPSDKSISKRDREIGLGLWKRDLSGRPSGTIDPWYGCFLLYEFMDYAINFTFPWTLGQSNRGAGFDVYDIPDALFPEALTDASVFLNDDRTRAALHAPTSKDWALNFDFVYGSNGLNDPSVEPMAFLSDLATNATSGNIPIVLYSGNDDALIAHRGTEVTIQNTTFGGIQGFTRKPSTPWYDDIGNFAGIVHQERNWTYVLFNGAGHMVPAAKPASAFTFLREFVLGNNETGLVTNSSGTVSVVGGENSTLAEDIMPGQDGIYYGSGTTQSTYTFPSATIAAWKGFIQTETSTHTGVLATSTASKANAAYQSEVPFWTCFVTAILCLTWPF